jgi:hypothetical protein
MNNDSQKICDFNEDNLFIKNSNGEADVFTNFMNNSIQEHSTKIDNGIDMIIVSELKNQEFRDKQTNK